MVYGVRRGVKAAGDHTGQGVVREGARWVDGVDVQGGDQWRTTSACWITLEVALQQQPGDRRRQRKVRLHVYFI